MDFERTIKQLCWCRSLDNDLISDSAELSHDSGGNEGDYCNSLSPMLQHLDQSAALGNVTNLPDYLQYCSCLTHFVFDEHRHRRCNCRQPTGLRSKEILD